MRAVRLDARDAAAGGAHVALHHRQHLSRPDLVRLGLRLSLSLTGFYTVLMLLQC